MKAHPSSERVGRWPARVIRRMAVALLWVLLASLTLWATTALWFDVRISWLRLPLATIYGLGMLAVWVRVCRPWKALITVAGFVLVLAWWFSLKPSNDRNWQPDVAMLPYADIAGNQVTIHNIRNCDYHTETNFDVRQHKQKLHTGGMGCSAHLKFLRAWRSFCPPREAGVWSCNRKAARNRQRTDIGPWANKGR